MSEGIMPSDKRYPKVNELVLMYGLLVNRQLANKYGNREQGFVAGVFMDNDGEAEIEATKQTVLKALNGELDEMEMESFMSGSFGEFIGSLEIPG